MTQHVAHRFDAPHFFDEAPRVRLVENMIVARSNAGPVSLDFRLQRPLEFFGAWLYFKRVGRTYIFECPLCQYRAKISGGRDSGLHCEIQTVVCRDCRELLDVFTRQRRLADAADVIKFPGFYRPEIPPVILCDSSVNPKRERPRPLIWRDFKLACPIEPKHSVEPWTDPGRCPRCGNFLEKNGLPFRLWD